MVDPSLIIDSSDRGEVVKMKDDGEERSGSGCSGSKWRRREGLF